MYGKQSLFIVLCTSSISHLPHKHQLIYQADEHSDAETKDPPNQPTNESVAGQKQPPATNESVAGLKQPPESLIDIPDSIEELVGGAYNLLVSNDLFLILLYTLYNTYTTSCIIIL